jgi:hypothetical protein
MKGVLIPSDNTDWAANFAIGYRSLGFDAVAGQINFELETGDFELLHILWPEEFTGWRAPTSGQVDSILARLDRWARRARIIVTVANLYPHRNSHDPQFRRLYNGFYERAEVIHHASQTSKELVCREFPSIAERNHMVRLGYNYERLLPPEATDRTDARRALGLRSDQTVFLVFGALRFWEEIQLLQSAFRRARIPNKLLLLRTSYAEEGPAWRQRWRRWRWREWQRSRCVQSLVERVSDAELPILFSASDAVVVIRQNSMSSGVPFMAMTFGRFVIAPSVGAIPEYLSGTGNVLYDPTLPENLACAMERAAVANREAVGRENARIAAGWGWKPIVQACVDALPRRQMRPDL